MLHLQLLGALGLTRADGSDVRPLLAQPKRLALFVYLLLAEPRGFQRRDKLVALFWPELSGEAARAALRRALHFLRTHLGDGVIVTRAEEEVAVAGERLACDALAFQEHLAARRDAEALALYHGDLLAGFFVSEAAPDLDEWLEGMRRRYREAAFAAAERLSDREEAAGRLSTARFWSQRALDLEPLSEPALLRALRVLEREGERVRALEVYEGFARRLQAELGVEPGPELRSFVHTLRERRPTPVASPSRPRAAEAALAKAAAGPPPPRPRRRWPLAAGLILLAAGAWIVASRQPAAPPVLGVGAVTPEGGADSSAVGATLPELLATGLGSLQGVHVISRARLYEVSGELGDREMTPAALLRAAKRAGANRLIEGEVYGQGPTPGWRLDLRLVDLGSGAVQRSWVLRAGDPFALADSATGRLAAELRRPAPAGRAAEYSSTSLIAQRYFDDGLRAYYRRDFATADALFGLALGEDPSYALALYYAAQTRSLLGSPSTEVLALARRARDAAERGTRYERLLIGAYWASATQSPLALPLTDSLLAAYPYEPEAYVLAGSEHFFAADFRGELRIYTRLAALDSGSLQTGSPWCRACAGLSGMATAYLAMDSVERALEVYRHLASVQPQSRGAWSGEIGALSALGRGAEALALLGARADTVGATDPEIALSRAWLGLARGEFAAAYSGVAALLALTGDSRREGLWVEGIGERMQGRYALALQTARRFEAGAAAAREPITTRGARLPRAIALFESGRAGAAAALFDSLRLQWDVRDTTVGYLARQHAWMLTHEITALAAAGDTTRLVQLTDTLQRVGRWSSYARDQRMYHYARGLLWDIRGSLPAAVADYRQALTSPTLGFTRINYRLARDLLALGRPTEAIGLLRAALHGGLEGPNLYVTHTELHELLARAFEAAGHADSAAVHYRWVADAWRGADEPFRARWHTAVEKAGRPLAVATPH
jgi:DNA-binding SARP family transcriptional activator